MKTNLNVKHDYITLKVEPVKGFRMNMTWNRYGHKITQSAPAGTTDEQFFFVFPKDLVKEISSLMGGRKENLGEFTKKWHGAFEKSTDVKSAVAAVKGI